jgi:hypothetical protein
MVCHICERPASAQCNKCFRFICSQHTAGVSTCSSCFQAFQKIAEDRLQAEAAAKRNNACAFCGALEDGSSHGRCAVCGRHFCTKHGVANSVRGPYTSVHVWTRCQDHPRQTRSFGLLTVILRSTPGPGDYEPADEIHDIYD